MARCINPKGKHWTVEEAAFVMTHYGPMTIDQMAEKLGRTYPSVQGFMQRFPWWHLRTETLKLMGRKK